MVTGNYSADLLTLLVWMVGIMGGSLVAVSVFFATKMLSRLDEMRLLMESELRTLKDLFHGIDKRVIRLEERSHIRRSDNENEC